MFMKKAIFFFIMMLLVASCVSTDKFNGLLEENRVLKNDISDLQKQLENALAELEHYKYAPDVLYAEAMTYKANKDRDNLDRISKELQKYHPQSSECLKVKQALESLDKEIAAKEKAEKEKRMKAVSKLKKSFDDVSGITWYKNPYFTHYYESNHISIYIGQRDGGKPWLRLKMSYNGNNWIFFEQAYLSFDGNTKQISFDQYKDKETDVDGGKVSEWIDVNVDASTIDFLKKMVEGKTSKMRLSGKFSNTKTLTTIEVNAIRDVLLAYDVLLKGE